MSVMECSKNGCDSVMCDRHSNKYGYICYECFDTLKESRDISIEDFMSKPKYEFDVPDDYEHWVRKLNMIFEDF